MQFKQFIGVLEVLASAETGATVGFIQKTNLFMTRGQVERTLKELITDGFVTVTQAPYRPLINKNIFHLTEKAVEYCEYVVTRYDNRAKQKPLFADNVDYVHHLDVMKQVDAGSAESVQS